MPSVRVPPNLFAIPFALTGLAGCWHVAAAHGLVSGTVAEVLFTVASVVWFGVLALYARGLRPFGAALRRDLTDRTVGPFVPLIGLTPMLVGAQFVHPWAPAAGVALVDASLAVTVLVGAWVTGDWIAGPVERDMIHPGWLIPTAAVGLVGAGATAAVGQPAIAMVTFGVGVLCWVVLAPVVLLRLVAGPPLPAALAPTMAIEVAPAAVATSAWFALSGGRVDPVIALLGGFGLLMVLVQLRLLPLYLRLRFMPSTWAFAFSWASVGTAVLQWLDGTTPIARFAVLAAVTLLVGGIAVRTVVALVRGTLLPAPVRADVAAGQHDPVAAAPR